MTEVVVGPELPGKCNVVKRGKRCRQPAGWGTDHSGVGPCKVHGGALQSVKQAWSGRFVELQAQRQLAKFASPVRDADPEQTLLDLVSEAAGNVAWLGRVVAELAAQDAPEGEGSPFTVGGLWRRAGGGYSEGGSLFGPIIDVDKDGTEHVVGEQERAMVKLYGQWADRLAKYAKAALDAGIEKRRVEMAERQGESIVVVINNVLVKMGLDGEAIRKARSLAAEELRVLDAGETT